MKVYLNSSSLIFNSKALEKDLDGVLKSGANLTTGGNLSQAEGYYYTLFDLSSVKGEGYIKVTTTCDNEYVGLASLTNNEPVINGSVYDTLNEMTNTKDNKTCILDLSQYPTAGWLAVGNGTIPTAMSAVWHAKNDFL